MFIIMWITGRTPASWTESTTIPSIMVHGKSDNELRALVQSRAKRIKVHIIEAGYCADTSHAEKDDEKVTQLQRQQNAACKAFAAANNYIYLDSMEMMLDSSITPSSAVLNSAVSANAVSLATTPALTAGATYKFLDGTAFYVFSVSGSTATIDGCINAQASSATLTQCGANYLTGTGKVGATTGKGSADVAVAADGTHPRDFGHRLLGWTEANLLVNAIQRRGLA